MRVRRTPDWREQAALLELIVDALATSQGDERDVDGEPLFEAPKQKGRFWLGRFSESFCMC